MKIYNSLSKKLEEFIPLQKDAVKIYICGITPYDTTHLGHAFTYLSFDSLIRFLKYKGYKVNYTQNVTDINDRDGDILKKAEEQNTSWQDLSKFWTDKFLKDMDSLNWIKPTNFLFASAQIHQMLEVIEKLHKNNLAYIVNGGIYLDIQKLKDFGKLSGFDKRKMLIAAKEFEEDLDNPDKKNPLDITLWKPTSPQQSKFIPSFNSKFGPGRPGWHLECSAMTISSLGAQIDIHGGGEDLIFPHHESEIAQSEGSTGKIPFSKYWLHTGTVGYGGQKMSKSKGNLVLVSDLLKKYSPNAIRYLLLSHHYRKAWEFNELELAKAEEIVSKIKQFFVPSMPLKREITKSVLMKEFESAMENDLNTPKALKILLEAVDAEAVEESKEMASILGFAISHKP